MITVTLFRNREHRLTGFTVSGHAGYAESGADIVCASVTTAAFTAVNGLTDVAGIEAGVSMEEGYLSCTLPEQLTEEKKAAAALLLESMALSLVNLAEQYSTYITLESRIQ